MSNINTAERNEGDAPVQAGQVSAESPNPVGKNRAETDLELGALRMNLLMPYAERRLGISPSAEPTGSLRANMVKLRRELRCGTDFIRDRVRFIIQEGIQNVRASHFLKSAPSSKGSLKIAVYIRQPLRVAVKLACVTHGYMPGSNIAREFIRHELLTNGISVAEIPCDETIDAQCKRPEIISARIVESQGDHMARVMQLQKPVVTANQIVFIDVTTFTSDEKDKARALYVLDDNDHVIGLGNVYFGLQGGSRDVWTALPFVRAPNG